MKNLSLLLGLLTLTVLSHAACPGQSTVSDPPRTLESKIRQRLDQIHQQGDFPGASLAMVLPDGSNLTWAVGQASIETRRPMQSSDRMMSASIGKTYFAAMAVKLIQQGKLSLDDKVIKYLGEKDWYSRIPNSNELTISHLMRHQSGLPRYILVRQVWRDIMADPDKIWRPGDQLKYIYDAKALHPAGQGWAYSDTNYILLGLVLENITLRDVYEYVDTEFLKPHKLVDTIPNNRRELPGLIQGYPKMFQTFGIPERVMVDGKFVFNPAMEWCGGGFASTPLDLARWARLYFSGELLENDYVPMLTDGAVDAGAMLGGDARYGLGVIIRSTDLGEMLGHDGGFPGYTSTMGYFPQNRVAAALMINSDGRQLLDRPANQVLVELVAMALEESGRSR